MGAIEKTLALDHDPRDVTRGDEPAAVGHGHAKDQPATFDRFEHDLGRHVRPDRARRQVGELHPVSDGRLAGRQRAGEGFDGRFLGQRDDSRRRENRNISTTERVCGVGFFDATGDACGHPEGQRHLRTIGIPLLPAGFV